MSLTGVSLSKWSRGSIRYSLSNLKLSYCRNSSPYLQPAQIAPIHWPHIDGLHLADPNFSMPGKIDLVLGASVYAQILENGIRRGNSDVLIAQKTVVGWILFGQFSNDNDHLSQNSVNGFQCSLDYEFLDLLQRFWNQEEIFPLPNAMFTPEETQYEEYIKTTHSRNA